jgi:uncharacterized protein DUF5317
VILIAAALACVALVPLTGGRLVRLLELRVRWSSAALGALALQVGITTLAPTGSAALHALLHVASYALAGACLIANRRIKGLPILALGAALNSLAILANRGVMPASAHAMDIAGLPPVDHFANSAPVDHPHLLALGDVIPVPGPWPLGNVLSLGDLLIIAGLFCILHHVSRARTSSDTSTGAPPSASPHAGRLRDPAAP